MNCYRNYISNKEKPSSGRTALQKIPFKTNDLERDEFVEQIFMYKIQAQKNSEAGEDLLSREANRSTIGAGGLNFRVRHGTGWTPSAILTCFHCSIKTDKTVSASSLSSSTSSFQASHLLQDSFNSTNLKQVKASTL